MKFVCEVPLRANDAERAQFHWLSGPENFLVTFENKRQLKVFSISDLDEPHEEQKASLKEESGSVGLAWNKDESYAAAIVNKLEIFIWDVRNNKFSRLEPAAPNQFSASGQQRTIKSSKTPIELVAWSKLTNRLAICYSSGQILLCGVRLTGASGTLSDQTFTSEDGRVVQNSEGVLKRIVYIEVCEHADLFAGITETSEMIIMTFDGLNLFYGQADSAHLSNAKFSPIKREYSHRTGEYLGKVIYVAYKADIGTIYTKSIPIDPSAEMQQETEPVAHWWRADDDSPLRASQHVHPGPVQAVVDFHWVGPARLLVCLASGSIKMIQLDAATQDSSPQTTASPVPTSGAIVRSAPPGPVRRIELMRPDQHGSSQLVPGASPPPPPPPSEQTSSCKPWAPDFKIFQVIQAPKRRESSQHSYAIAVGTSYRLYYYELFQDHRGPSLEHFDDIDLSKALQRLNQRLECARWSRDCSLLALQLTNGLLVIYRTRLQGYMVATQGPRTAYLSAPQEVTILNFEPVERPQTSPSDTAEDGASEQDAGVDGAMILPVHLRPSVMAIGVSHLAVALNNRVRFYLLSSDDDRPRFYEQEYAAIVSAIGLGSRFAAVHFDDGHLKLHSLKLSPSTQPKCGAKDPDELERFFPDPSRPERISAFNLTEQLFVYATHQRTIAIFCLRTWRIAQVCSYSIPGLGSVRRLKPNVCGNKFACVTEPESSSGSAPGGNRSSNKSSRANIANVLLYDVYSNQVYPVSSTARSLWSRVVEKQIMLTCAILPLAESTLRRLQKDTGFTDTIERRPAMSDVVDAIWDTDGRALLLIQQASIHVLAVLDHTLEREEPVVEYAASVGKPSSYTTLHATQGVISNQTNLGRVINSILDTHNDDLMLCQLEARVQSVKQRCQRNQLSAMNDHETDKSTCDQKETNLVDPLEAHLEVALLKVGYLCTVLPIYTLAKCRGICRLLAEERAFNLEHARPVTRTRRLTDQIIWKVLASWALYTLNLDFAALIYRTQNLQVHSKTLDKILEEISSGRSNMMRSVVADRVLALLIPRQSE